MPGIASMKLGAETAGFALGPMAQVIQTIYGMGAAVSEFLDAHIDALKISDNPTIVSTGRVLEAAKFGFGLGYVSTVTVLTVGQVLLGNPLSAAGVVISGVTLSNPIAMTCAAVGAIYFGWDALTEKERSGILDRLSLGLSLGVELIRSVVAFVVRTAQSLLSSRQLLEFKDYIKAQALLFGKSLYDVTGKVGDLVKGAAETIGELSGGAADATRDLAKDVYEAASSAAAAGKETAGRLGASISKSVKTRTFRTNPTLEQGTVNAAEPLPIQTRQSPTPRSKTARKPPLD